MAEEAAIPFSFDPARALRALRILIDDPDDTAQVFTIIESFSGYAPRRITARFRADPRGKRLLESRARILGLLADRARLEAMPDGSLARAYLDFLDREGISAEGLVAASVEGESSTWRRANDFGYISDRLRDTHDLWHAVTGYHGDLLGEAALLAFSLPHTGNPGVALIVLAAMLRARDRELTHMVIEGFLKGRRAAWLPAVEWEALLPLPLDEVRAKLGIEPVRSYEPIRSNWIRETGNFRASA